MAYYMAQTKRVEKNHYQAICEVHGVIGDFPADPYGDDAADAAALHDTQVHDYDGEDGFEME